jgi:hypothetical protein
MLKNKYLTIVLLWILWGVGVDYLSEEVINRPMNQAIQLITIISVLIMTVLLVRKTYNIIITLLNN